MIEFFVLFVAWIVVLVRWIFGGRGYS